MKASLTTIAALLAVGLLASASQAGTAGIKGSKHDFGLQTWSSNQTCLPCHTPHNSTLKDTNGVLLGGPLWNHTLSTATYTLYSQNQKDATGALVIDASGNTVIQGVTGNVDQSSKLCLSCHDGTIAMDSFGNINGSAQGGSTLMTGSSMLGTDLSVDHPIGDHGLYPTTDGKTSTKTSMVAPSLRTAAGIMPLAVMSTGKYAVGCTTCHEPHNATTAEHMLWVSNSGSATTVDLRTVSGSALCLNCHIK